MTVRDHEQVTDWCNEEGWNLSHSNMETYYASDPESYFLGEIEGKVICIVSATTFNDFVNADFYLVESTGKIYDWPYFLLL